mgnify:CR=1 FL=1
MLKSVNSLFITYNWLYIYTIIKTKQMKKLQTLILILAPSYFIGRFIIGLVFNL